MLWNWKYIVWSKGSQKIKIITSLLRARERVLQGQLSNDGAEEKGWAEQSHDLQQSKGQVASVSTI